MIVNFKKSSIHFSAPLSGVGAPKSQQRQKVPEARIQASHCTLKAATMSDVDDPDVPETPDSSLASSRSRRGPSKKSNSRFEALKKLKAAKARDWSYEVRL